MRGECCVKVISKGREYVKEALSGTREVYGYAKPGSAWIHLHCCRNKGIHEKETSA